MLDLNKAPTQRDGELIPDGTIAPVVITIRPGGVGDGGYLKRSKGGDSMALDAEFTVLEGPFAKRKIWGLYTMDGETAGHQKAAEISAGFIRGIIESAYGIRPNDESPEAIAKRRIEYEDLDGLRFMAKIGVQKGSGEYKDKNKINYALVPGQAAYRQLEQVNTAPAPAVTSAAPKASGKPAWAA